VRHGHGHDDLTAELFSVRARVLLGKARREDAAAYASGLLIGYDLKTGLGGRGGDVAVIGRPDLTRLFAAAIRSCGRKAREIDGETAFLAGARHLAELIQ
jgi:2-dehydro-3-deoxygalactonokinase